MSTVSCRRLSEADRKTIRVEMKPLKGLFVFFMAMAGFVAVLCCYALHLVAVGIAGAAALLLIGYLVVRNKLYDYRLDLEEDEKEVTVCRVDALELNPQDGVFLGEPRNVSSAVEHPNYLVGHYVRIGHIRYAVSAETYDQLQGAEYCEKHTAPHSRTFLGIYPE